LNNDLAFLSLPSSQDNTTLASTNIIDTDKEIEHIFRFITYCFGFFAWIHLHLFILLLSPFFADATATAEHLLLHPNTTLRTLLLSLGATVAYKELRKSRHELKVYIFIFVFTATFYIRFLTAAEESLNWQERECWMYFMPWNEVSVTRGVFIECINRLPVWEWWHVCSVKRMTVEAKLRYGGPEVQENGVVVLSEMSEEAIRWYDAWLRTAYWCFFESAVRCVMRRRDFNTGGNRVLRPHSITNSELWTGVLGLGLVAWIVLDLRKQAVKEATLRKSN
jgi:hypothetical protein